MPGRAARRNCRPVTSPLQRIENALLSLGADAKRVASNKTGVAHCRVNGHGKGNGDQNPSLSYGERADGSVWVKCHAGCDRDAVLASLGLTRRDSHRNAGEQPNRPRWHTVILQARRRPDSNAVRLEGLAERFRSDLLPTSCIQLARDLNLTVESLLSLHVGWDANTGTWSFPMCDGDGQLVGFRLRRRDGTKFSVKGGREGLFLPKDLPVENRLIVAEGPTDTAALLGLGFRAVGRPSCCGGVAEIVRLVRRLRPAGVVIAADRDRPGQDGAQKLANALVIHVAIRVISPPTKDMRDWITVGGATLQDVEKRIAEANQRHLGCAVVVAAEGRP